MIEHERRARELLPAAQVQLCGNASVPGLEPRQGCRELETRPGDYERRKRDFFEQVLVLL